MLSDFWDRLLMVFLLAHGRMGGGETRLVTSKNKGSDSGGGRASLLENMVIGLFEFYVCPWVFFWVFL